MRRALQKRLGIQAHFPGARVSSMPILFVSSIRMSVFAAEIHLTRTSRTLCVIDNISSAPLLSSSPLDVSVDGYATEILSTLKCPTLCVPLLSSTSRLSYSRPYR
jgi:hypothetical protein